MSRSIVRFRRAETIGWGVRGPRGIRPITGDHSRLADLIEAGDQTFERLSALGDDGAIALRDVTLLSPVTTPCQIVCQGQNYREHMREAGQDVAAKDYNQLFTKAASSLSAVSDPIVRPAHVRLLDYELELGLIIGRPITAPTNVTDENLHEFVFGAVMANDVSARDVQLTQGQWFKGKSYRGFCPVGPWLRTLDPGDGPRLRDLRLKLWVDGELRQDGHTADMIYSPAETLTELSQLMDLWPGDLVLTGTPAGVALKAPSAWVMRASAVLPEATRMKLFVERQTKNPKYLKNGNRLRSTIRSSDGTFDLGECEQTVVAEEAATSRTFGARHG